MIVCLWKSIIEGLCLLIFLWSFVFESLCLSHYVYMFIFESMYLCLCLWRLVSICFFKQLRLFIFNLKFYVCVFEGLCLPMNLKIYVYMCLWNVFVFVFVAHGQKFCLWISLKFCVYLFLWRFVSICLSLKVYVYLKFYKVCYVRKTWKYRMQITISNKTTNHSNSY
jgi:hypothetical protein